MSKADESNTETTESDILFPDKAITINGEAVTVREFSYLEGLNAAVIAGPLLADLLALIDSKADFSLTDLDGIIAKNSETWVELLGLSVGKAADWVAALSDTDGTLLSMRFWESNGPFLLRRVAFAKQFGKIILSPPAAN